MRVDSNVHMPITLSDESTKVLQNALSPPAQQKGQGISFGTASDSAKTMGSNGGFPEPGIQWNSRGFASFFKRVGQIQQENAKNLDRIIENAMKEVEKTTSSVQFSVTMEPYNAAKDPEVLAAIDNSKYSSPKELHKWDKMVSHLPPGQREGAAKELNRAYAAARLARDGGAAGERAMAFINANPAIRTAADTAEGGKYSKADGKITSKDLKVFANKLEDRAKEAGEMMDEYHEKHPQADEQSLSMARSAALMFANDPIIRSGSAAKAYGAAGQQDTKYLNKSDLQALSDPANNPGLPPQLIEASRLWGNPGMFNILDDLGLRGKDVARHGGDQLADFHDFRSFIENLAPTSGEEFADFMSYAAMSNATAKIDTSKLDGDVFKHPEQYTGAAKAGVLMRLQRMNEYVIAGRDIRDTEGTEKELQAKIEQLQDDPDVQKFLEEKSKENKKAIINSSSDLSRSVTRHMHDEVLTGNALKKSLQSHDGKPLSAEQATQALAGFHDEVQLYQDLTGSHLEVADIVSDRPDLERKLRQVSGEVSSGDLLTELANKKGTSAEDALNGYWTSVAFMDDALAKTSDGGLGIPGGNVLKKALKKAGIDSQQLNAINDSTLKALMSSKDNVMSKQFQQLETGSGNLLLDKLKDTAIKKGAKWIAKKGAKFATKMAASIAGRAVAAAAGQAAGAAISSTLSAAGGPIGAIAGAAVAVGFGIADLVGFFKGKAKKRRERRDFDHTVTQTLNQFGITRPK
ncbi:type III effector HrpK domain-containing protein [Vibrio mangrovi]|uniref:Type III effector HrpK domain-containing protein n=1 Tax=Vibrio mangrovi TaxID=474394 RepID=A0A1Y6IW72_9VIBR|nr:type III effector HrpK domain-containing protein [Vibrio mangrovi]MDW6002542.1 type III effector HrpK domain-containing protein [Vibrio mangrovi]SMS01925.1 hypothetical protein VIM7927_03236 [Vibrio mangrovi]